MLVEAWANRHVKYCVTISQKEKKNSVTPQKKQTQIVDNQELGSNRLYKRGDRHNVPRMGYKIGNARKKRRSKNNRSINNTNIYLDILDKKNKERPVLC